MDPFAAIGLAGNIITFLDFGYKLISAAKDIYVSASGASADNDDLSTRSQQLQQLAATLKISKPGGSLSDQERSLLNVAAQCMDASKDLEKLLDKLKARNPKSKRAAIRAAVRNWRKEDEKDALEQKLDHCRQQLNLELLSLTRTESLERLDKLIAHGQASSDEMRSLTRNMESLRLGNTTSCLGDDALQQIRSLLNLTDDAVLKVRQARVLDGLRFELMNERFEDIEVAHKKTFDWIFDSTTIRDAESDTFGSDVASCGSDVASFGRYMSSFGSGTTSLSNDVGVGSGLQSEISDSNIEEREDYRDQNEDVEDNQSLVITSQLLNDDSEINLNKSSKVLSLVRGNTLSPDVSKRTAFRNLFVNQGQFVQIIPENDVGDDSDGSFELFVDEPSPKNDDQMSYNSDGEESVGTSSHVSYSTPAQSGTARVLHSSWQSLTEVRTIFITWLEQGNGIFHISGKPGSGKSTLMKYLTQHPRTKEHLDIWASGRKLVSGKFFFWKPGSDLQKSIKGLIRGLLHRLLSECPDLIPLAFPKYWELSMHRDVIHIDHDECQPAFEKLIAVSHTGLEHKFMLFIDGLDEFEGNHAYLIRKLFQWTDKSQNIKLCISSREWAIFQDAFQSCPKLRLHELTAPDIQQFINDRFREIQTEIPLEDGDVYRLKRTIVDLSDGVFLWVSLVLRHIEEGVHNGDRMNDLMRLIESLPTDLEPMLQQLADSIPPHNRKLAYSMLLLATCYDDVPLMQYSFMEEYSDDRNFATNLAIGFRTARENEMRLEKAKKRVYGVCKGFLDLRKERSIASNLLGDMVRFTHRSIAEFLDSPYLKEKINMEQLDFDPSDAWCQTYLGLLKCVRLPRSYFIPSVKYQDFILAEAIFGAYSVWPFFYRFTHSFLKGVELAVVHHVVLGPERDASRFCKFLDSICQALTSLESEAAEKYLIKLRARQIIHCHVADIPILICALHGFHKFFEYRRNIRSELTAPWISACVLAFHSMRRWHGEQYWSRACKSLQILLDNGTSPNAGLPPNPEPMFHSLVADWCGGQPGEGGPPSLACIALLLYQGVNPRFSMVTSSKRYRAIGGLKESKLVFKVYFTSGRLKTEHQVDRVRIGPDNLYYYIEATPETLDILNTYGHIISLRELVSIWFPDHSNILQQAIDWILGLGVDINTQHRVQLQSQFESLLRPLFDQDHPNFVGWVFTDNWWPRNVMNSAFVPGTSYDVPKPQGITTIYILD